jgi:hypothetical protein
MLKFGFGVGPAAKTWTRRLFPLCYADVCLIMVFNLWNMEKAGAGGVWRLVLVLASGPYPY